MTNVSSKRNKNKILNIATFMLPEHTPDGEVREDLHQQLEEELALEFANVHTYVADSLYMDKDSEELVHDAVIVYNVAIQNTSSHLDKLKAVALTYADYLDQDFVQFRQPNGEVYFLDVMPNEKQNKKKK